MMHRLSDWQSRLERFLQENRTRRFVYGEWDCCLFVAAAIQAMTGTHPAPEYVGVYSNRSGAIDLIKRETGRTGAEFIWRKVMQKNGFIEGSAKFAQRGDPVLVSRKTDNSIGILGPDCRLFVLSRHGLAIVDRSFIVRSWQV